MKFELLEVRKRLSRLASLVYELMRKYQDYGFKDQITRSARPVPSNIPEGLEQETAREERGFFITVKVF